MSQLNQGDGYPQLEANGSTYQPGIKSHHCQAVKVVKECYTEPMLRRVKYMITP